MTIPYLFLIFAGYYYTYSLPDVGNSGNVASFGMVLVFLTANKTNSLFSLVLGIPFERLLGFHKWAACVSLLLSILHAHAAWKDDVASGAAPTLLQFPREDSAHASGSLITIALSLLLLTSFFSFFRRRFFDVWLVIHVLLIIAVALTCWAHSVSIVVIAAVWWLIDVVVRYLFMAGCMYPSSATLRKLRPDVIEIRFPKPNGFHYNPGQFLRIALPRLSALQFHPFSISSAPHEEEVTLHVRALGNWTRQLLQLAEEEEGNEIKIWMEGPYGIASVNLDHERYRMVLCVSGGIGVTHCRSIARSILHDHHENGRKLDQMRFVWAVRDYNLVKDLPPFGDSANQQSGSVLKVSDMFLLQAEVYISNSRGSGDVENLDYRVEDQQLVVLNGRPDMDKILTEMKEEAMANGVTHIAVFGCGPQSQIDTLKEACHRHSKNVLDSNGVYFDLHLEVFEF